jgi:tetratricopeptide (TPR) repeat protein
VIELLLQAERALAVGLVDQAERLYSQAIAADPRNSIAVVGLARVALEHSDDAEAYRRARQALQIDPENVAANRLARRLEEVHALGGSPATPAATAAIPSSSPAPAVSPAAQPPPPPTPASEPAPLPPPTPASEPAPLPEPELPAPRAAEPPTNRRPWAVAETEIEPPVPARRRSLLDRILRRNRT